MGFVIPLPLDAQAALWLEAPDSLKNVKLKSRVILRMEQH